MPSGRSTRGTREMGSARISARYPHSGPQFLHKGLAYVTLPFPHSIPLAGDVVDPFTVRCMQMVRLKYFLSQLRRKMSITGNKETMTELQVRE